MSEEKPRTTAVPRLHALIVVGAFLSALIAAGHGVGPIGLLLVLGWDYWRGPVILGWAAIVVLVVGSLTPGPRAWAITLVGAICTAMSWCAFAVHSEALPATIIYSLPYLLSVAFLFLRMLVPRAE